MSKLIETSQATLERTEEGTFEVRFKPGITLDKQGLMEVLAERERMCTGERVHAVLTIFPSEVDFELGIMTQDHYKGQKVTDCTGFLALTANSVMHERMASLYFAYFPQPFVTKVFMDEVEARAWLRQQVGERSMN